MPTVLVIDDDPLVASSVRAAAPEWTLLEAYDGAAGIAVVRTHHSSLDLIVLDVRMPQHDGILVCVQLRTEFPDLPILPITGAIEAIPMLTGLGCLSPLLKPVPLDLLATALHAAIGTRPPPLSASRCSDGSGERSLPNWRNSENQQYPLQPSYGQGRIKELPCTRSRKQ
jgi:CheY-like chemotaxis protein